ncbi:MDR family MFS transporter [Furfurilactobacillus sp. WILCCON 0119]
MKTTYNRRFLVAAVVISAFVTMLNQTILSVAQPKLMTAFSLSTATVQWLSTGYALVSGVLIPITAWLADRYNTKHLFVTTELIFLFGTIIASFAPSFGWLLLGRFVQAMGAGILSGLAMTILFSVYPKDERSTPTALLGIVFGLAPAVGPTLGGWLVDTWGWHSIFIAMLPVIILAVLMGLFFMADVVPHRVIPLDWPSVIYSMSGFGLLLFGFSNVGNHGWGAASTIAPIICGSIITALFLFRQGRIKNPILQLRVFGQGNFALAAIISAIAQISMVAVEFILPLYLQNVRNLTAFQSGLTLLPGAIVMFLMSPLAGKLLGAGKGRTIVIFGVLVMTLSTLALTFITLTTPIWLVILAYAIRNVGLSFVMMPASTLGMQSLPRDLISHGSSSNNMVRQIGAAIGTAILVSIMSNVATTTSPSAKLLQTDRQAFTTGIHQALVNGAHAALWAATAIGALGVILSLFLKSDQQLNQ